MSETELHRIRQLLDGINEDTTELAKAIQRNTDSMLNPTTVGHGAKEGAAIGLIGPTMIPFSIGAKMAGPKHGTLADGFAEIFFGSVVALPFIFITAPAGLALTLPGAAAGALYGAGAQAASVIISRPTVIKNLRTIYATVLTLYQRLVPDQSQISPALETVSTAAAAPREPTATELAGIDALFDELHRRIDVVLERHTSAHPVFDVSEVIPYPLHPRLLSLIDKLSHYNSFNLNNEKIRKAMKWFTRKDQPSLIERLAVLGALYYYIKNHGGAYYSSDHQKILDELFQ